MQRTLQVLSVLSAKHLQASQIVPASTDSIDQWFDQGTSGDEMFQMLQTELSHLERKSLTRTGINPYEDERVGWLRRMKELKRVVLWLQHDPRFGQFCYYGCWCLPDGNHGFTKGIGKPIDNVDRSCQNQYRCYHCAQKDFGENLKHECRPEKTKYKYELTWNPDNKKDVDQRDVVCLDQWNNSDQESCSRAICECDRALAISLRTSVQEWMVNNHQKWGTFNATEGCVKSEPNGSGNGGEEHCCGDYTNGVRFPYRDRNGQRDCCGTKTYNTGVLQCCDASASETKNIGSC